MRTTRYGIHVALLSLLLSSACGDGTGGSDEQSPERFEGMPPMNDQMIDDVREYAGENPERVAEVVQSWVYEPENSGGR